MFLFQPFVSILFVELLFCPLFFTGRTQRPILPCVLLNYSLAGTPLFTFQSSSCPAFFFYSRYIRYPKWDLRPKSFWFHIGQMQIPSSQFLLVHNRQTDLRLRCFGPCFAYIFSPYTALGGELSKALSKPSTWSNICSLHCRALQMFGIFSRIFRSSLAMMVE